MNHAALVERIEEGTAALSQTLPAGAAGKLATLVEELERWNRRINLTSIEGLYNMVARHVLDSLALRPYLVGEHIIDIGTGAGFPGLPLAIAEPDRQFTMLDAVAKKLSFVRHIIGLFGLENAGIVHSRAEDYAPGSRFDTVIARALAETARLTELGGHLLGEGGVLLAPKGKAPIEELRNLPGLWEYSVTELTVPGLEGHARHLVSLTRARES